MSVNSNLQQSSMIAKPNHLQMSMNANQNLLQRSMNVNQYLRREFIIEKSQTSTKKCFARNQAIDQVLKNLFDSVFFLKISRYRISWLIFLQLALRSIVFSSVLYKELEHLPCLR